MNRRKFLKSLMMGGMAVAALNIKQPSHVLASPYKPPKDRKKTTHADRKSAALRAKQQGLQAGVPMAGMAMPMPGGVPDYFGPYSNYALSPLPTVDPITLAVTGGIRKFVDSLPGLGAAGANNLGQYMPVAVPDTTTYPGSDYYEISLVEYTERMHTDLLPTTLRGYVQTNTTDATVSVPHYLGPLIIAQKDRPVRVKFTNQLPLGAGGNLSIPVDTTYMGAGMGPDGVSMYTQNRGTIHLHGGNTPWISDGTTHQWTTPAGETTPYPKGVSVQSVPDMPAAGPGELTFFYTNQQTARLLFYHDHAYGITRLNVYAGVAAGYLIQDPVEQTLVNGGTIPGTSVVVAPGTIPAAQIPLVIQDKTFVWGDPTAMTGTWAKDPTWALPADAIKSNLWFPHVYMPNQNPADAMGSSAMGRWDYGPWFWPPYTGLQHQPIANPYYDPINAPWEPAQIPATPNPSGVPEGFMDTPVVNGTVYPYVQVGQKAYRFRILNACNDRYLNLQLYFAKSNAAMWDAVSGALLDANAGEVSMVPAVAGLPGTAGYPADITDGRDGGVPDTTTAGPALIQIGTESGFLPAVAVRPNTPIGYEYNRRSVTVLNVSTKTILLGPAERADVIIDFSGVPDGSKLILYNDAPAPVPAFDPRNDFYTGDPDNTTTGGAPSTLPGYGPNTRTIMQFQVSAAIGTAQPFNLPALQAALPAAFAASQHTPIVAQSVYNAAYNVTVPAEVYPTVQQWSRIQDTSMNISVPSLNLTLTNPGFGYTAVPLVSFTGGSGVGAAAVAALTPASVAGLSLTSGGSGYTSAPTVAITNGGTGATATATLATRSVASVAITASGSGYASVPTVTFSVPPTGTRATGTATVANRRVTGITITNPGSGYVTPPTITFTGGGGSGAAATATLAPAAVASLTLTNGGSGYTSPKVTFTGGGGSGAAATATLSPTSLASLTMTNQGAGYFAAPTVTITPVNANDGKATAIATIAFSTINVGMKPKAIQELFTVDYGRMNATFGVEIPNTSATTQTTIPYGYIDPPTEIVKLWDPTAPLNSDANGTQIWKITHNGVDTHAIHFHLFDVQIVNRVGWDGMVKPPEPNEVGWKDTVRMNPLEDCIVALRPIAQNLPFDLPNSIRSMDVTMPATSTTGFAGIDPINEPAAVTNVPVNFGYEYVWHCHLLGHEENDMMRPLCLGVAPKVPTNLAASVSKQTITLTWVNPAKNATGFTIQRAVSAAGPWTTIATVPVTTLKYVDAGLAKKTTYYYQVIANNVVGYTQTYAAPTVGYPHQSFDSAPAAPIPATTA